MRPFLKWAGNKYRLAERIRKALPEGKRLVEPFAGAAAVFLNTDYDRYLVSDSNADLIALFQILKREGEAFIADCEPLFRSENNRESRYYRLREEFNQSRDSRRRAALFIYLNRHGYNGLCRYNASGGFNVPFGRYKRPYFPAEEMLAFHLRARRATFRVQDFRETLLAARSGDVIYCDPPYVPLSASASFTSYSAGGFDLAAQEALARLAHQTAKRGIPVLISNHDTDFTKGIYQGAHLTRFAVHRSISCNVENRVKAGELLALFQPA